MTIRSFGRIADRRPEVDDRPPETFTCLSCGGIFPNDMSGRGVSHCAACHMTFRSLAGFDDHRTDAPAPDYRRCRTEDEMRARGYEPNDKGYWRKPRPIDTIPGAANDRPIDDEPPPRPPPTKPLPPPKKDEDDE